MPPPSPQRIAARFLLPAVLLLASACQAPPPVPGAPLSEAERQAIAAAVEARLREATDLRAGGDVLARMLGVYPDSGRVVSASAGMVTVERDSLAAALGAFWQNVGQNMVTPEWRWGTMHIDVLGPDAAAVTATYRIPHRTPDGRPHVLGGAWTAVFARRDGAWVIVQEHLSDDLRPLGATPE